MSFPFFIMKKAPVTGVESLMDYQASLIGERRGTRTNMWLRVVVPVTSLCPCSKRISAYGAHNQRSHITITARLKSHIWLEELIDIAEREASSQLYGILKRPDEKYVTEHAYDHPKFVEDMVRDVAEGLLTTRASQLTSSKPRTSSRSTTIRPMPASKRASRPDEDAQTSLAWAGIPALQAADESAQEHAVEAQLARGRDLLQQG